MDEEAANLIEMVRRAYDALSWRYRADDADVGRYAPWIAALLAALDLGSHVVDLGCGVPVARDLSDAGHRYLAEQLGIGDVAGVAQPQPKRFGWRPDSCRSGCPSACLAASPSQSNDSGTFTVASAAVTSASFASMSGTCQ